MELPELSVATQYSHICNHLSSKPGDSLKGEQGAETQDHTETT